MRLTSQSHPTVPHPMSRKQQARRKSNAAECSALSYWLIGRDRIENNTEILTHIKETVAYAKVGSSPA
ncbi:MAG: hypothetical protein WCA45_13825 [Thiobacillaceae bacterium]